MSINCYIPSKDRAAQLNLLLYSLQKNAPGIFSPQIMYKSSGLEFDQGYDRIIQKWVDYDVEFTQEFDAEKQFYSFLEENAARDRLICLFSDDCIFYRKTNINENVLKNIFANEDIFSFTYRLGKNITIKDYVIEEKCGHYPEEYTNIARGRAISWDYTKVPFWQMHGFTVGFDAYLYRAKDLLDLSERKSFPRICEWEHMICRQFLDKGSLRKLMASPHESCVFVQQINTVHGLPHRTNHTCNVSPKDMNSKLLEGYEIDFEDMGWVNPPINCTHGERCFSWRKMS